MDAQVLDPGDWFLLLLEEGMGDEVGHLEEIVSVGAAERGASDEVLYRDVPGDKTAAGSPIRLTIKPNGYVGIGTTSPEYLLHLSAGENVGTQLAVGRSTQYGEPLFKFNPAGVNYLSLGFSSGTVFSNNVEEALAIQRTGNVGIGTTSPGAHTSVAMPPAKVSPHTSRMCTKMG